MGLLYWQARLPLWNAHLQIDVWVWYERVTYFFRHQSFSGLKGNELLPTTLFYVFIPAIFSGWSSVVYFLYLQATIAVNLFILLLHYLSCRSHDWVIKAGLFSLLILSFGPIALFRFDGLATLLVILGLLFWQKKKFSFSGLALGLATGIKLYPLIFIPYLSLILFTHRRFKPLKNFLVFYLIAILLPIFAFFSFGGSFNQIVEALSFHGNKYVSIESLPASLLTAFSLLKFHQPPPLLAGYGVWGIDLSFVTKLQLPFFNYIWIFPVGIFYLYLLFTKKFLQQINLGIIFCLTLVFLVFSKNLNPQYIWWFVSLFPFLKFNPLIFVLLLFINIFNQLVYPLFYTQFIENFYQQNQQFAVFYCLLLRNLLIVILTVVGLWSVLVKRAVRS